MATNQIFLPSVQPGLAANFPDQIVDTVTASQPSVVSLTLQVVINSDPEPVAKTARIYGPGDVTGIDLQQVVRVEPKPATTNFEPNYFPLIEFDRPDFPWLFTPAKAGAQGQLRPWLCLVVVRKQAGVTLRSSGNERLAVLEIRTPAKPGDELPDLAESNLWVHAQVTGAGRAELDKTLSGDPARSVSRLLCPRRLASSTEYIACVVPAFDIGRKAGLDKPIEPADEQKLDPAWFSRSQAPAEIELPIYYSWEFRTGEGGDFEDLVRRLEPRVVPPQTGKRPMDISTPGFLIEPPPQPDSPGTVLGLEGALRIAGFEEDPWPETIRVPFQTALRNILNTPWLVASRPDVRQDPIVAPPIYGCWQAAARQLGDTAPAWLNDLNLDPRHRAMAAMGTQVVQSQQEQLMASAWEQLGDIERVNQRLRQAQLSREVNQRYHSKAFNRFSDEAFLRIVSPAKSRLVVEETVPGQPPVRTLLAQKLATSVVPASAVSAPLRKMARPRGAINRQYFQAGQSGAVGMFRLFNIISPLTFTDAGAAARGAVIVDVISDAAATLIQLQEVRDHRTNTVTMGQFIWNPDPPPHWERVRADFIPMLSTFRFAKISGSAIAATPRPATTTQDFYDAAKAHQTYLTGLFTSVSPLQIRNAMPAGALKASVMASLDPGTTVQTAMLAGISRGSPAAATGDDLEPVMDGPVFPQPMYEALRDLSQDYLFPGLEHVPANTVQLLQTNARFIESFMVGLNVEMSRELLWRGYPTDQRGTYFQQFWDTRASEHPQLDIPPIQQWAPVPLGSTAAGARGDRLVLLLRGELLRRYPRTSIYAVKAVTGADGKLTLSTNAGDERHPLFRGSLEPDVTFAGFDLRPEDMTVDKGWFFVLQEQPSEPRFGLDDSETVPELTTWNDLHWNHVKSDGHILVKETQLAPSNPADAAKGKWGRNSAHMAYITKQRPVRVAIHANELLP